MSSAFLYGKLPAHGDFVCRGLTPEVEAVWDGWASGELAQARDMIPDDFDAAHEASPGWGFVSGPGLLGKGWRCGAIAASIDAAGRRFLVVAGLDGLAAEEAAFIGDGAAASAEEAIRAILSGRLEVDAALGLVERQLAPQPASLKAAAGLAARPEAGVWWSLAGLVEPAVGDGPPEGLVAASLNRVSALLEKSA
jgi:type VI secretion system ImpM family protein